MKVTLARTFLEVLASRSFSNAAERLCVTQAAVTMRINSLEDLLGQQLFTRTRTGVELTVAGRKFEPYATSLVQLWQQARQALALPADISALFTIGCDTALWVNLVCDWIGIMRQESPEVALETEVRHSNHLMQRLAQGLTHAVVVYEPQPHHGVIVEHLYDDALVLVSREPREKVRWHPAYVFVQWTNEFRAQHNAIMPIDVTPSVVFADGMFALEYILLFGGSGYFPLRMVLADLQAGNLHVVQRTPIMNCSVHFAYASALADFDWFQKARGRLFSLAERQRDLVREHLETGISSNGSG